MRLTGERLQLSKDGRRSNPWRMLVFAALIAGGVLLYRSVEVGSVQPLFLATPTPTRTAASYREEAQAHFSSGDLGRAIEAYQNAVEKSPDDAQLWAELARIQTYESSLQPNASAREARLAEARQSIDRAVEIDPDISFVSAVRALVYDWSASFYSADNRELFDEYMREARQSAETAERLEPGNALVMAFKAEVLLDLQNYALAQDLAEEAVNRAASNPTDPFNVDIYRVSAQVLEAGAAYRSAIEQYQKAVALNPNLTFLYLKIGANFRQLRDVERALEAFDTAARINEQNRVNDPIPYLAIGRTYLQEGEFFVAARNVERAVVIDRGNPELWGFLGIVYYKARNYESALPVLACAVEGCTAAETGELICETLQIAACDTPDAQIQDYGALVPGTELRSDSLEIYYTYASALAFLNECDAAEPIFQQLMSAYGDDAVVRGIVEENRALCAGIAPTSTPPPPDANS